MSMKSDISVNNMDMDLKLTPKETNDNIDMAVRLRKPTDQKYVYTATSRPFPELFSVITVILLKNIPIPFKFNSCKIYATN